MLSGEGASTGGISERLATSIPTISRWRQRYREAGVDGLLHDKTRPGRRPKLGEAKRREVIERTLHQKPAHATHWSTRSMAAVSGISPSAVQRIWKAHGLQPHRVETFKLSRDPHFLEKLTDVVGLYLDPPEKALVLCVGEKSQIQALDRTQPGLPMKRGRAGTMTHDYKRPGTLTLFAALDVASGDVIGTCSERHRHDEFLAFLRKLDRQTPADLDLHLILDNYATHKHPHVQDWLARHPRFHLHCIPTSSSWLNLVERLFSELTEKRLRRGVFKSLKELEKAIIEYLDRRNERPTPFTWTATVRTILEKVGKKLTKCWKHYTSDNAVDGRPPASGSSRGRPGAGPFPAPTNWG